MLFRVNVRDTQTGLKLIRRDVLAAVLPRMLEKRYAFDLELLVVARSLGFSRVFEAPGPDRLQVREPDRPALGLRIALDTVAIFYRHYVLDTYRDAGRSRLRPRQLARAAPRPALGQRLPGETARLRILFLNWRDIENPDAGGAEVFTHEVAKRWVAAGHDVTLLASGFVARDPRENRRRPRPPARPASLGLVPSRACSGSWPRSAASTWWSTASTRFRP